jgi:hypothetical protein
MTWRGARSSVSKSVTHGAQLANLPVQLLCLGRQNLSIYPKAPVRREHERYLIQRKTGNLTEGDHRELFQHPRIEQTTQTAPPDGSDQASLFVVSQG